MKLQYLNIKWVFLKIWRASSFYTWHCFTIYDLNVNLAWNNSTKNCPGKEQGNTNILLQSANTCIISKGSHLVLPKYYESCFFKFFWNHSRFYNLPYLIRKKSTPWIFNQDSQHPNICWIPDMSSYDNSLHPRYMIPIMLRCICMQKR